MTPESNDKNYFQSFELPSNDENIRKSLQEDKLGRKKYLKNFAKILDNIDYNCTIAVDGAWGCGKTFFVKQLVLLL